MERDRDRDRDRVTERDAGMVTAETAVALPALLAVLAVALWAVGAVSAQLRCTDAAGVAARSVARGDAVGQAEEAARRVAPAGAVVEVDRDPRLVTVVVRVQVHPLGTGLALPAVDVRGRAVAEREDRLP